MQLQVTMELEVINIDQFHLLIEKKKKETWRRRKNKNHGCSFNVNNNQRSIYRSTCDHGYHSILKT